MDFISHGLWGGIAFGKKSHRSFLLSFCFGIAPDVLAFGPFFVGAFLGLTPRPAARLEPPQESIIPHYVHSVYQATHSIVIFAAVFFLVAIVFRKPIWEMLAWGLHVIMDIPTHSPSFFPTPFLWPFSDFTFSGIPWGRPTIFFPNAALLVMLYTFYFLKKRRARTHETK